MELHGDRGGYDDPAMVCGLGSIDGITFMFIGNQKVGPLPCLLSKAVSATTVADVVRDPPPP